MFFLLTVVPNVDPACLLLAVVPNVFLLTVVPNVDPACLLLAVVPNVFFLTVVPNVFSPMLILAGWLAYRHQLLLSCVNLKTYLRGEGYP